METKNTQVKSKKRVADHGEVFTNEREVNAMLDLVEQDTKKFDVKENKLLSLDSELIELLLRDNTTKKILFVN